MAIKQWETKSIICPEDKPYALIVLNRPLKFESSVFKQLWNDAKIRVLVDGGANRWFKYITKNNLINDVEKPSFTVGDMDSITDESCRRLDEMNCKRIYTPDQDETDCMKAVLTIRPYLDSNKIEDVVIITDFGGRIDQTMSQINALFKTISDSINVYLRSHDTLAWLLCAGQHQIEIPKTFVTDEFWCSYIPMNGSSIVSTTGLKWDLTSAICEFGGIVSTSNTYKSSTITIESDKCLLWSMATQKESIK